MSAPPETRPGHALVEWKRLDEQGSPRDGLWACRRVDGVVVVAHGDEIAVHHGYAFVATEPRAPRVDRAPRRRDDAAAVLLLIVFGFIYGAVIWFAGGGQ